MHTEEMIPVSEFCYNNEIELSLIHSFGDAGLINISIIGEQTFLSANELSQLEKLVRLHHELDINLEGIETVTHLLQQIGQMQQQILQLQNRLAFYENV